jgi:transposase
MCWPDPLPGRSRRAVVELDRPKRTGRRHGARSDPLDATRAAREALGRDQLAQPRAPGQRAALQVRLTARRAAVQAALRALARRIHLLDAEIADHTRAITSLVRAWPPDLLGRCGVARSWPPPCCGPGPILAAAAQMLPLPCWAAPHPIPASSGQTVRVRLNRSGGPPAQPGLHLVILTRRRDDPATRADAERRRAQGKTNREIRRCLVRYVARQPYRLLQATPTL